MRQLQTVLRKLQGTMFEIDPLSIHWASGHDVRVDAVWLLRVLEALEAYVNSDEWMSK